MRGASSNRAPALLLPAFMVIQGPTADPPLAGRSVGASSRALAGAAQV